MGRHAGFLTAASVLGKKRDDDGPHLVYVPERPVSMDKFVSDVVGVYEKLGRCVVAVSEGICDVDGVTWAKKLAEHERFIDEHEVESKDTAEKEIVEEEKGVVDARKDELEAEKTRIMQDIETINTQKENLETTKIKIAAEGKFNSDDYKLLAEEHKVMEEKEKEKKELLDKLDAEIMELGKKEEEEIAEKTEHIEEEEKEDKEDIDEEKEEKQSRWQRLKNSKVGQIKRNVVGKDIFKKRVAVPVKSAAETGKQHFKAVMGNDEESQEAKAALKEKYTNAGQKIRGIKDRVMEKSPFTTLIILGLLIDWIIKPVVGRGPFTYVLDFFMFLYVYMGVLKGLEQENFSDKIKTAIAPIIIFF